MLDQELIKRLEIGAKIMIEYEWRKFLLNWLKQNEPIFYNKYFKQ